MLVEISLIKLKKLLLNKKSRVCANSILEIDWCLLKFIPKYWKNNKNNSFSGKAKKKSIFIL